MFVKGFRARQTPSLPIPKISDQSPWGGNVLHSDMNRTVDWRNDGSISFFRDFVKSEITKILVAHYYWQPDGSDFVGLLENIIFLESQSMEDYMNLDTLAKRLQIVIHDAAKSPERNLNNVSKTYDTTIMDFPGVFGVVRGEVGRIAGGMVPSPEMNSTVTSCSSANGFSETGVFGSESGIFEGDNICNFEHGTSEVNSQMQHVASGEMDLVNFTCVTRNPIAPALPSALGNGSQTSVENLPLWGSEVSDGYPGLISLDPALLRSLQTGSHMFQEYHNQPHDSSGDSRRSTLGEEFNSFPIRHELFSSMSGLVLGTDSKLPSEQPHSSDFSSNCSEVSDEVFRLADSSATFQMSMERKVLFAYANYKESAFSMGDCLPSFLQYLHGILCKNFSCMCASFIQILSHFDFCGSLNCNICGPVRDHSCANRYQQNYETSGRPGSLLLENSLHPLKRLKMEHGSARVPSGARIPSAEALPGDPDEVPPMQKFPNSLLCTDPGLMEVNIELPANVVDVTQGSRKNADVSLGRNCHINQMDSGYLTAGDKSVRVASGNVSDVTEFMKNDVDISKLDSSLAKGCDIGEPTTQIMSVDGPDQSNFENRPDAADIQEGVKGQSLKIRGVSLVDFFTAQEIKKHISSLQQRVSKKTSNEEEQNSIAHIIQSSSDRATCSTNDNTCQLCLLDKLLLAPVTIYCSCCAGRIKHGITYYTLEEETIRHCFCNACHKSRGNTIRFYGRSVLKMNLVKRKNDEENEESWVQCDKCKKWQHQICALFNDKKDVEGNAEYVCPKCCLEDLACFGLFPLPKDNLYDANALPRTRLSDYLEKRLCQRLQQERTERANALGKNFEEVPGAEDLTVRVVLSVKKLLKVKKQFLEILGSNYPVEFPYVSKVILLFQKIEGVDVCLFALYVQEFGSRCSYPNQRSIYISYLDSVKYFRPETETASKEALRTFVYHEILVGYLDYCKKRGFATCYLWACPPQRGEDYILYCHPENQKTPKPDKLRRWYNSMIRKAEKENIVVSSTNLYEHFFIPSAQSDSKITAARLPYFDGDYWSTVAENIFKKIEEQGGDYSAKAAKKVMKNRTMKAMGHTNPSGTAIKDMLLMQKLGQAIFPAKDDFIIVHLQFVCTYCNREIVSGCRWFCAECKNFNLCGRCRDTKLSHLEDAHILNNKEKHLLSKVMVNDVPSDTKDEDVDIDSWLFEDRHTFLSFCQKNHYQFDTLRRAKHSSMMILHHARSPESPMFGATTCKFCHVETRGHDVCSTCCRKKAGPKKLIDSAIPESLPATDPGCHTSHEQAGYLPLQRTSHKRKLQSNVVMGSVLDALPHASVCPVTRSNGCPYKNCSVLKRLFSHATKCSTRSSGGCLLCRAVWNILRLHSLECSEPNCRVPRCSDLKEYVALKKNQQQQHQ
ncbi:unnamed protein product [Linum trigynum]|uniref:histone acetyltransferase n=1 Tax=Linum trigynum TaxID=586398 RepID=A0AAV2EYA8_9ROSI